MKQQIICVRCQKELRELHQSDEPYPGEHLKFVEGEALRRFLCDHCNHDILEYEDCFAYSIWADHSGQPYYEWENQFIKIYNEKHE